MGSVPKMVKNKVMKNQLQMCPRQLSGRKNNLVLVTGSGQNQHLQQVRTKRCSLLYSNTWTWLVNPQNASSDTRKIICGTKLNQNQFLNNAIVLRHLRTPRWRWRKIRRDYDRKYLRAAKLQGNPARSTRVILTHYFTAPQRRRELKSHGHWPDNPHPFSKNELKF